MQNPWVDGDSQSAPFDQPFYLIIDLAVGGTSGWFPDGVGGKPWFDKSGSECQCYSSLSYASVLIFAAHHYSCDARLRPGAEHVVRDVANGRERSRVESVRRPVPQCLCLRRSH